MMAYKSTVAGHLEMVAKAAVAAALECGIEMDIYNDEEHLVAIVNANGSIEGHSQRCGWDERDILQAVADKMEVKIRF